MSARRFGAALVIIVAALVLPAASHAQTREATQAGQKARAEYEIGRGEFRLGHYAAAARAFRESYVADPQPLMLYNIAQAERKAGELRAARDDYRRYLTARPDAPDRADVERNIAEIERELASQPASPSTQPPPRGAAAPPPLAAPTPAAPPPAAPVVVAETRGEPTARDAATRKRRVALGVGLGVGALVVVGTVLAVTLTLPSGPPHAALGEYRPFP